ncbi:MAG: DUF2163 domain-containing protein, partial [Pseudomonadota bacterium]
AATGMSADTHDVSGILKSEHIGEIDISRGLYDAAEVVVFLVDWTDTTSRLLLSRGQIGRIRRDGLTFEAEVTGISDRLNRPFGRAYVHSCECRLGDEKCGINLASGSYRGAGTISESFDGHHFSVTGINPFAAGWFTGGSLILKTGGNAGSSSNVKLHQHVSGIVRLEVWLPPAMPVEAGDTFDITAGCNKTATVCRTKFGNLRNFRGFPHMPGDDIATSYPAQGGNHNGGSLLR